MESNKSITSYLFPLIISVGLLLTLWLRTPFLHEGSPYMYREDEAHHFNRIVNMMKSGDLNPHYFHKPSLHFYLRLPVVSAAFLWAVKKGEANSLSDIVTSDPFGVADYAFSVSHPRLLLLSRAFSLLQQLGCILLTYLICRRLINGRRLPFVAALLYAISPAAISESAVIGVDGVMTFFCLVTVWLGLRSLEIKSTLSLFWCAFCAGLAISSKYNSLPIIFVPLLLYFIQRPLTLERALIAFAIPWLAFLAASPYIIFSLPEFLNQSAYEIWHYGVAGHVGHMAEPGLSQARFYLNWLASDGLGIIAISLSICGIILTIRNISKAKLAVTLAFPALFFLLMVAQKANFERNMVVIIPFVGIFAAVALSYLKLIVDKRILAVIIVLSLVQPFLTALETRAKAASISESRLAAASQIQTLAQQGNELALDGRLQFTRRLLETPGVSRADFSNASATKAFQDGFDYLVSGVGEKLKFLDSGLFEETMLFDGIKESQRIVQNPAIVFLRKKLSPGLSQIIALADTTTPLNFSFSPGQSEISFANETEPQLWLKNSVEILKFGVEPTGSNHKNLILSLFSPWPNQALTFYVDSRTIEVDLSAKNNAEVSIELDPGKKEQKIIVKSLRVHSPKALGISSDTRRLAVAIKRAIIS